MEGRGGGIPMERGIRFGMVQTVTVKRKIETTFCSYCYENDPFGLTEYLKGLKGHGEKRGRNMGGVSQPQKGAGPTSGRSFSLQSLVTRRQLCSTERDGGHVSLQSAGCEQMVRVGGGCSCCGCCRSGRIGTAREDQTTVLVHRRTLGHGLLRCSVRDSCSIGGGVGDGGVILEGAGRPLPGIRCCGRCSSGSCSRAGGTAGSSRS
ncbi:hypothetical protein PENTCL1PPCAC_25108 [Pristionchus entomophagus]|uniref:Uncharacterized protein n=1 Tax=Pristionchus entomophagus TaxID=358040 RepID=A0AAV5UA09_9BILA|nr:hypothetical protein PENTCL1PPCAC_25108 [Pristionchus entomophagus]